MDIIKRQTIFCHRMITLCNFDWIIGKNVIILNGLLQLPNKLFKTLQGEGGQMGRAAIVAAAEAGRDRGIADGRVHAASSAA